MAGLIPEDATRLQAIAFVQGAELAAIGRDEIIRASAKRLAESALRKILSDCIRTEGDYQGYQGQTLVLDAYVLSPQELHKMLAEARKQGERDATHWGTHNATKPTGG